MTCPWPPEYLEVLEWQWEKVVIPYWTKRAKFAADHGVKIAIEMHPGFLVYSPETMLRLRPRPGLRSAAITIRATCSGKGSIPWLRSVFSAMRSFTFTPRTREIYDRNLPMTGVLDTKPYTDERNRAWMFRTCGYGHGEEWWRSSSPRCGCSATTTSCPSSMRTVC